MNKIVTTPYDVADHLRTAEEIAAYLQAIFAEADGDATFSAAALGEYFTCQGHGSSRTRHRCIAGESVQGPLWSADAQF
jgi:hypothetical protein